MIRFAQGDIITIDGRIDEFAVVSNDSFIKAADALHVCPIICGCDPGPTHIAASIIKKDGKKCDADTTCVICEQMRLVNPRIHKCMATGRLSKNAVEEVADVLQGLFECE